MISSKARMESRDQAEKFSEELQHTLQSLQQHYGSDRGYAAATGMLTAWLCWMAEELPARQRREWVDRVSQYRRSREGEWIMDRLKEHHQ